MLLAAVSIVGILIGVLQGPVWLIAAAIAALLVGLATAFLGMVLLYRALVTPASGPQPTPRKK